MKRRPPWQVAILQPKTWRELLRLMRSYRCGLIVAMGNEHILKILGRE